MGLNRRRLGLVAAAWIAAGQAGAQAQARARLLLVTGAAGGAFSEYGPLLAKVVAAHAPIDCDVQATAGSNDNIRAIARGEADLGLVNMGPAYDAREGRAPFKPDPAYAGLRALFPMYETPFSIVALKRAGIRGLGDLDGRLVGVGPAGGPGELFFNGLAKALGLKPRVATGSPSDLARRLIAGEIDAFWFGAGVPVAAFVEVLDKADAVVLGLSPSEIAALRSVFGYFAPVEIPAGTYKRQSAPLATAAVWNFVVASDRLADDVAYDLTRAALDHAGEIQAELPAAAGTRAANIVADTFLPVHPGAIRYYREKGLAVPAHLVP